MEITFKIPEDLYSNYKSICMANRTLSANNLKAYMRACILEYEMSHKQIEENNSDELFIKSRC